ncbi:TetR/AcrR family transcriptional regulator [Schaalia naturae]|uniref:TetR/AcrR family transcriptional regulator n=1 Tax=Schaalia naturae TaxID=635203 RepID=A0ABW2SII7_9ACTO
MAASSRRTRRSGRPRGPGRPPAGGEDKRERVLVEAMSLFAAHGYAGTSLGAIAEAADISKAGLLHHFSSKDRLFAAVLERRDRLAMEGVLNGSDGDIWQIVDRWLALIEDNARHPEGVALYVALSDAAVDPAHPAHAWLLRHLDNAVEWLRGAVERGKQRGTVRPEAPSELIARTLVAVSDGTQIQWSASRAGGDGGRDLTAETRLVCGLIEEQWRAPGSAPADPRGREDAAR